MTYTRIAFWRAGVLVQVVDLDLGSRTPRQARRTLRVWFARMVSLEVDDKFTVRVDVGSEYV